MGLATSSGRSLQLELVSDELLKLLCNFCLLSLFCCLRWWSFLVWPTDPRLYLIFPKAFGDFLYIHKFRFGLASSLKLRSRSCSLLIFMKAFLQIVFIIFFIYKVFLNLLPLLFLIRSAGCPAPRSLLGIISICVWVYIGSFDIESDMGIKSFIGRLRLSLLSTTSINCVLFQNINFLTCLQLRV